MGTQPSAAAVRRLQDLAILDVEGDDSRAWLNGQLTNDVRETAKGDAVYALAVTVKGKILADVWAFDRGDERFWLAVPKSTVPSLLENFESQIIMEDVEVTEVEGATVVAVVGPDAAAVIGAVPNAAERAFPTQRLGAAAVDVVVDAASTDLEAQLVAAAEARGGGRIDEGAWELARHRAMQPRYGVDFDGRHYPQEAGLKERAVSFNKGCYLGQEVVCMLENRGKLRRRLVALGMDGTVSLDAETKILNDQGDDVGEVTSAVTDGEQTIVFGYVKAALAEPGQALSIDGHAARVTAHVG